MKSPIKDSIGVAIGRAFPRPIAPTKPAVDLPTADQKQLAEPSPKPGLAGSPRDRTVAHAGVRLPDRPHPAPIPHPGPTGGPVGNFGTSGPIGPWGSWK